MSEADLTITFGHAGNAHNFLGSGWSDPEDGCN